MANATVNLSLTQSGYVKKSDPYTVFKTNTNTEYQISTQIDKLLYFCIPDMPAGLRHNVLIGFSATFAIKCGISYPNYVSMHGCNRFDPNTLTFNNKPEPYNMSCSIESDRSGQLKNRTFPYKESGQRTSSLLKLGGVVLEGVQYNDPNYQVWAKTVLVNGSTRPYITVTYDDSAKIKSKISYGSSQLSGTISNTVAKTLTWDLVEDTSAVSGYCADPTWNQASAVFKYRKQGESTWLTRNVSGSTKSITIPAGTFQSGASYEYQITVTDEDGTVSSTSVYTFTVAATSVTPSNAPTSGYANPRNPISFGWVYQSTAGGTIASGATTLHWRVSGAETWNDVQAAAGVNSLTIPANTFPTASTIQWYLSGSDSTGYASQTSIYSFSTAAGLVRATAISPSNTIESNNQPITFKWSYSSPDGFEPTRYLFLWKLVTDESYTTLRDSTDVVDEYTFPAYTFPAGEIKWCVNAYNIDGVKDVGYVKTFISYGAPAAPVVYAEAIPFTTVEWQADDQQAYQVKVDDVIYGPYFGTEKIFSIPDKLEDGEHTIDVSVIGTYALWSEWGTSVINVQNAPGEEIVLTGVSGIDNMLNWETEEATADFLIFRDGVQIGHTARTTFADRYASGEHSYQVLNRLTDGNYSESNTVTLETTAAGTYITERVGGEWLEIKYSKMDMRDPEYEVSADGSFYHLAGDEWPSGSLSGHKESKVSFSALFLAEQETERKRFESLLGKEVILKFRDGTVFTTVLNNWKKKLKKLSWTAYSFTLQRIETEDYVDDTT